jgi:hypothetical protein
VLPWLANATIPQRLNDRGDQFLQENHGNLLYKAFFY